ncbi:SDR family oxidoreductase [Phytohabitans flavus]|nr:SDR family oxidoreductase [Phytohabitans flavus]
MLFDKRAESYPSVVVVTGASAGVGRAVARRFAQRKVKLGLIARGEAGLSKAAEEVRAAGGEALAIPVDVSDPDAVRAAADRFETELGPIDCWVNNAFTSVFAPFQEVTPAEFRRVTEVTYLGYVNGTRVALERMVPRRWGTIVQVGSALAYRGIPLQTAYCGAKHAIQGFTEALRCEMIHDRTNVNVTMVQLPAVNTPQFDWVLSRLPRRAQPVPPIYQPEVAADAIVFAADHPQRREFWVGWSTALSILGNRLVPRLMDFYLARTGYGSQQTDAPRDPDRPSNLWRPVDGPDGDVHGAHGSFDDRSRQAGPQVWLSKHRGSVVGATMSAAGGVAALANRLRGR